ncbi:MAG: hypothetical protein ABIT76_09585 [Chthoniobacterales bacterium]
MNLSPAHSLLKYLSLIAGVVAIAVTVANAKELLKETFENASGGEELARSLDASTTWICRGSREGIAVTTDPSGLNHGKAMNIKNVLCYTDIPEAELQVGDSLHLTFRFRYRGTGQENAFPLRVGFVGNGSGQVMDGNSPGYWYLTNPNAAKGNAMIAFEEGTDGALGGGSDIAALGKVEEASHCGTQVSNFSMTVSRGPEGITIECKEGDAESFSRVDAASKVTLFNILAISVIGSEGDFVVDDIDLTLKKADK